MALHSKDDVKHSLSDDVYGSADIGKVMPKYKMPEHEHDAEVAYSVVTD